MAMQLNAEWIRMRSSFVNWLDVPLTGALELWSKDLRRDAMRNQSLLSLAFLLGACMEWVPVGLPAPAGDSAQVAGWNQVRLGVGDSGVLILRNATARGDSIRGWVGANDPASPDSMIPIAVALRSVTRIEARRTDAVRTVLLAGTLVGGVALAASMRGMGWNGSVGIPCGLLGEPCPAYSVRRP
jgi:hypothetical protein